jgi:hypothetical protein
MMFDEMRRSCRISLTNQSNEVKKNFLSIFFSFHSKKIFFIYIRGFFILFREKNMKLIEAMRRDNERE